MATGYRVQVLAVERVERLLRSVCGALDEAGIEYAVVGGNAIALWVSTVDEEAVRATKDVDLLVHRNDLRKIAEATQSVGLIPDEVLGVHILVDRERPSPRSGVHLVIAEEKIRPHYQHPAPAPGANRRLDGLSVLELEELLVMKLQSRRHIDLAHVRDLLDVGLIDSAWIEHLPEDLAAQFDEILAEPQ